jgi:DNA transformation protein and related proteins
LAVLPRYSQATLYPSELATIGILFALICICEKIRLLGNGDEPMKNMGPRSSEWLAAVGIHSLDDVAQLGVVETYKRVKAAYPEKVTLNLLWGLQAARELPRDIKEELRKQVEER